MKITQQNFVSQMSAGNEKALEYKRRYKEQLLEHNWEEHCRTQENHLLIDQIEEEFSQETRQMLSCLKPHDRELFLRLYVEEESIDEVSRHTGIKKTVLYNRISRGKKKIRSLFSSRPKGEELYEK